MNKLEFTHSTKDNKKISAYKYYGELQAKAVLLIIHGMAEHARRYEHFAKKLIGDNIIVYTYDQRGHGKTSGRVENLGYFSEKNGWEKVVSDVDEFVDLIKLENPNLPIFVLGHSMGSFISRNFAINNSNKITGLIVSGTAGSAGFIGKIGNLIVHFIILIKGKKHISKLMDKMSFGSFNNAFKPNRTNFDWLSRDNSEVDKYINDEFCGTVFTAGFYADLIHGVELVNKQKNINKISKSLPVYFFSGDKDPVSKNGRQIKQVYEMFKKAQISDVSMKLYKNARHETLNETNREEVMSDIINWIGERV